MKCPKCQDEVVTIGGGYYACRKEGCTFCGHLEPHETASLNAKELIAKEIREAANLIAIGLLTTARCSSNISDAKIQPLKSELKKRGVDLL